MAGAKVNTTHLSSFSARFCIFCAWPSDFPFLFCGAAGLSPFSPLPSAAASILCDHSAFATFIASFSPSRSGESSSKLIASGTLSSFRNTTRPSPFGKPVVLSVYSLIFGLPSASGKMKPALLKTSLISSNVASGGRRCINTAVLRGPGFCRAAFLDGPASPSAPALRFFRLSRASSVAAGVYHRTQQRLLRPDCDMGPTDSSTPSTAYAACCAASTSSSTTGIQALAAMFHSSSSPVSGFSNIHLPLCVSKCMFGLSLVIVVEAEEVVDAPPLLVLASAANPLVSDIVDRHKHKQQHSFK